MDTKDDQLFANGPPSNPNTRPLPPGWKQQYNEEHDSYFYINKNAPGGPKTQWTHPADDGDNERYLPPPVAPPGRGRSPSPAPGAPPQYTPPSGPPGVPQYVKRSFLVRMAVKKDYIEYPPDSRPGDGTMPPDAIPLKGYDGSDGGPVRVKAPQDPELVRQAQMIHGVQGVVNSGFSGFAGTQWAR